MSSIYVDGGRGGDSQGAPPVASIPLAVPMAQTSTINIHFAFPQGLGFPPAMAPAPASPEPPPERTFSIESADSARGSMPAEDALSLNSQTSQSSSNLTKDSLPDELHNTLHVSSPRDAHETIDESGVVDDDVAFGSELGGADGHQVDYPRNWETARKSVSSPTFPIYESVEDTEFWEEGSPGRSSSDFGMDLDDMQAQWDAHHDPSYTRVGFWKDDEVHVILQLRCSSEELAGNPVFIVLLQELVKRCADIMKNSESLKDQVRLNAVKLNKMKMANGSTAYDRVTEVAKQLNGDVIAYAAFCRRFTDDPWPEEKAYIGVELREIINRAGHFQVAKSGVMVVLEKKSKYAVTREFSEQLVDHIHAQKPDTLGNKPDLPARKETAHKSNLEKTKKKSRREARDTKEPTQLLIQSFKRDPTINIAEAARRSFVEVLGFVLYE